MRLQLVDGHPGSLQAQLLRAEVDVVAARLAASAVGAAALTHHVVRQVQASAGAPGRAPLQVDRGLVHVGDEVDRSGWRSWREGRVEECVTDGKCGVEQGEEIKRKTLLLMTLIVIV